MARTRKTHSRRHSRRLRGGSLSALSPASVDSILPGPKLHNVDIGPMNQESVDWSQVKEEQGGYNVGQMGGRRRRRTSRKHRKSAKKSDKKSRKMHRGGKKVRKSRKHKKSHRRMRGGSSCGC